MNSIIGLLLTIYSISCVLGASNEQFSLDSEDPDETRSYSGYIIQVYKPDGEAFTITFSQRKGDKDRVYCLNFARIFEATDYDPACTTDCTYQIVDGTEVDLAGSCDVTDNGDGTFQAVCTPGTATLTLDFTFQQDAEGNYGIQYTMNLEGYTMTNTEASFVIEQSVAECSDKYAQSGDSGEDSDDDDDSDEPTTTASTSRRLLEEDDANSMDDESNGESDASGSDSENEESGISSDDSNEFDVDAASFNIDGVACDVCDTTTKETCGEGNTALTYNMVYQRTTKSIQLVIDPFTCDLFVDPWFGIDKSKTDAGSMVKGGIAIVIGVVVMLLF